MWEGRKEGRGESGDRKKRDSCEGKEVAVKIDRSPRPTHTYKFIYHKVGNNVGHIRICALMTLNGNLRTYNQSAFIAT